MPNLLLLLLAASTNTCSLLALVSTSPMLTTSTAICRNTRVVTPSVSHGNRNMDSTKSL